MISSRIKAYVINRVKRNIVGEYYYRGYIARIQSFIEINKHRLSKFAFLQLFQQFVLGILWSSISLTKKIFLYWQIKGICANTEKIKVL